MNTINIKALSEEVQKLETKVKEAIELPSVETTDEGKVLTVDSEGHWAAEEIPSQLPTVTSLDEGSLLTVNSSGEWAKGNPIVGNIDYSTTEQDTGVKWLDGKSIYSKTYSGTFDSTEGTNVIFTDTTIEMLVDIKLRTISSGNNMVVNYSSVQAYYHTTSGNCFVIVPGGYTSKDYTLTVYYTKKTPTREPDEEPEVKKVSKKKTTK